MFCMNMFSFVFQQCCQWKHGQDQTVFVFLNPNICVAIFWMPGLFWLRMMQCDQTAHNQLQLQKTNMSIFGSLRAVFAIVTRQFYASFSYCTFLKLCVNTNTLLCWLYFEGDQTTDMPTPIQRTRFEHNIQTWSFLCVMICSSRWSYGVLRSTRWNGWISSKSHKMVRKELQSFCWCCKSNTK